MLRLVCIAEAHLDATSLCQGLHPFNTSCTDSGILGAAGSIVFGIFRSRTSAHYFKEDVVSGGAAYIPTGRGYALSHTPFVKLYSSYARRYDACAVQASPL